MTSEGHGGRRRAAAPRRRAVLAATLAIAGLIAVPVAGKIKPYPPAEVTNFLLGPEYAQWLVGPVAHIATSEERRRYLALNDDEAAKAFIEAFWEKRGPNLEFPPTGPKITFDRRAQEADRRFSEGTYLGRRTDRGLIFILYGSPRSVDYGSSPTGLGEPVEIWNYSKQTEPGLDGKKPDRRYGFRPHDGLTKFFSLAGVRKLRKTPSPVPIRE